MKKEKFWTWFISLIIIFGIMKSFVLPVLIPTFIKRSPWMKGKGAIINLSVHIPILIGFIYFLATHNELKKRTEFSYWTIVGILMIGVGGILPLLQRTFIGSFYGEAWKWFLNELYNLSETVPYAIGFGIAIGFFRLEDEKILLWFFLPVAILWIFGPLPFSLIYHLHINNFGLGYGLERTSVTISNGAPLWLFPQCLWDVWFWADNITDYSLAVFVLSALYKNIKTMNIKFLKRKKMGY